MTTGTVSTGSKTQKARVSHLVRRMNRQRSLPRVKRKKSTKAKDDAGKGAPDSRQKALAAQKQLPRIGANQHEDKLPIDHETLMEAVSKYLQMAHLPKMPHRPTRDELLAAANGFWQRAKVRFKWFSIRSMRPWNSDEWGAFISWFLFGHLVWILVGTTTFFSLVILLINTVFAQETLARWVGDYLTRSAGLTVVFESAIVPKWGDGFITFRHVFVSRRSGQLKSSVTKGSSTTAAEAAAAVRASQPAAATGGEVDEDDDGNYAQYDLTIDTVNVTLSFVKWWNGRGLLKEVEIKGVRGVVDRTMVQWTDDRDPLSFRHKHETGDFELDHLRLEDLLVTVHQPNGFRPFPISIYSCELPQLRKQWLFYDFLSASHISGSYDGSLFTIHPRQVHHPTELEDASAWKKLSRMRIDALKIDHLNRGVEGPFGWINEGNVDIIADIMFPPDDEEGIGKVVAEFYDMMEEAVTSNRYVRMLDQKGIWIPSWDSDSPARQNAEVSTSVSSSHDKSQPHQCALLVMDIRTHLNHVRATVPLFNNRHISYVNQALVRPIVAYINTKRTYIPITCRIIKRASDFDGAQSPHDCGLLDNLSAEIYAAFARDVEDQQNRMRRLKRVGLWTVSLLVHALLAGVAGELL